MKRFFMIGLACWLICTSIAGAALVDNGDGTISDDRTGLMWQKDGTAAGTMNWEAALSYCENLVLPVGVHDDWHLPSTQELQSLVDYSGQNIKSINNDFFPDTEAYDYWTSTTYDDYYDYVWTVHFSDGRITFLGKDANAYVRAVRWQNNNAAAVKQYTIKPIGVGRGIVDPGRAFNAGIDSAPELVLTPCSGWHVDGVISTLAGALAEESGNPGIYRYTLAPVYGSGTVTVYFVWDGYPLETADTDGDGIEDSWERNNFDDSLTVANCCSDDDGDGFRDIFEFQHYRDNVTDSDGNIFNPTVKNSPHRARVDSQCSSDCYLSIRDALVEFKDEPLVLKLREGEFLEDLELSQHGATLVLRGGYNDDFSNQVGFTAINGVVTISSGSIVMENIVIK